MRTTGRCVPLEVALFLFSTAILCPAQTPATAPSAKAPEQSSSSASDPSKAYYHFMLARRYRELAGISNRMDLIERAVSEYKQALEADPDSLFLRVELAGLYSHTRHVDQAIREAEAVLKIDPNYADAHRLLAEVYWRSLGESQSDSKQAEENVRKATEHLEALTRLDPSDAEEFVSLGRLYKLSNQPAQAEEAFKKAFAKDPSSKSALTNLAQLHFEQGDYDQVIEALKGLPEEEMEPQLLSMLAVSYSQTHSFSQAEALFERALTQDPENHEVRRAYAEVLMNVGKNDMARTQLQKILKADPEDGATYLRLAQLDRQEGRFDQARQELEHAKTLSPDNLEVPYQQALLEDLVGNGEKAIQILQGLVKRTEQPEGKYTVAEVNNRAVFLERLGLVYRSQEKFDQAIDTFREVVALGKGQASRGEALVIETLRLNHRPKEAMSEADAAVKKYPDERSLIMLRATVLGEQGRVDEAAQQLNALLGKTPSDREVNLTLAQVYSQAKRFPEAEAAVGKVLTLESKSGDQEYAHFVLGSVYEREKKYDLAEQEFKKVMAANPMNAAAANYLGYMLADRGVRLEESVSYIKKAVDLEPNNGAYLDSLGWAYFKMNRLDLAAPPLEKAARLVSNDPTIHEHLGHVYLQMGKKVRAQEEWERALKEWPDAVSSDFDAEQANRLRKDLDDLKTRLAKERPAHH